MKYITRIFLLLLFLSYSWGNTNFYHTHIVDGVKISHSHPFSTQSQHQHSEEALELIFNLSDPDFSENCFHAYVAPIDFFTSDLFFETNSEAYSKLKIYSLFRRPPPFILA